MSEIKVNSIKGTGASTAAITVNSSDGTCTANITNNLSNRNLIINGAMNVAQRGTSSTSDGYKFVDRFQTAIANLSTGSNVTRSQQSLSSSDTGPFEAGFRKYARMATAAAGTANANAYIEIYTHLEAQNIANSGWDYGSTTKNITLSFWFRCSVNQTFYAYLQSRDGTMQAYAFSFTASGNNTWTKITKTIPGNSNLTFDDNNGSGMSIYWVPFFGTDYTNNKTLDTWAAYDQNNQIPNMASTWLTSGAATWDITGIQLEVGNVATDFEHRSFAQELTLCQRYYQQVYFYWNTGSTNSNYLYYVGGQFNPIMRAAPSLVAAYDNNNENSFETRDGSTWRTGLPTLIEAQPEGIVLRSNNNVVFNAIKGIAHFNAEL